MLTHIGGCYMQLECGLMPNVMAAQLNIGGALCESSVIPFLVPRHKVWLTAAARAPCSNTANIGEHKTWRQSEFCSCQNSVRGKNPPNVYNSPGDGQTSCEALLTSVKRRRCTGVVTKPTRGTGWNLLGYPKLANRSQSLVGRSHHSVRTCEGGIAVYIAG